MARGTAVTLSDDARRLWIRAMPIVFVLLWSTGFIGAKFGLPYAEPLTFLAIRFAFATVLLASIGLALRLPWPASLRDTAHFAVAGLLVQGVYLGAMFAAIALGVEAGVAALLASLQPLLVAGLAGVLLGERVGRRQWLGLALGLAGVVLVVSRKLGLGYGTPAGIGLAIVAVLGITFGTIYQKRFCQGMNLVTGNVVQFGASGIAVYALALAFEDRVVIWSGEFVFAMFWLVVVLSIGAVTLLYLLIRWGEASRVSSLFFLVPGSTAVIAYFLFGETFGPLSLAGIVLAAIGVALATAPPKNPVRS